LRKRIGKSGGEGKERRREQADLHINRNGREEWCEEADRRFMMTMKVSRQTRV